jgi:hypothetical protein
VAIYVVAVLAIILYGYYLRATETKDILETKIIDHPSCPGFDGWASLHFILFGLIGFLYPNHHVQALAVSLGWEGIEHLLGTTNIEMSGKRLQLIGDQDEEGRPIKGKKDSYWYGRFVTDNSFNVSAYILGSAAANKWWPNVEI